MMIIITNMIYQNIILEKGIFLLPAHKRIKVTNKHDKE